MLLVWSPVNRCQLNLVNMLRAAEGRGVLLIWSRLSRRRLAKVIIEEAKATQNIYQVFPLPICCYIKIIIERSAGRKIFKCHSRNAEIELFVWFVNMHFVYVEIMGHYTEKFSSNIYGNCMQVKKAP